MSNNELRGRSRTVTTTSQLIGRTVDMSWATSSLSTYDGCDVGCLYWQAVQNNSCSSAFVLKALNSTAHTVDGEYFQWELIGGYEDKAEVHRGGTFPPPTWQPYNLTYSNSQRCESHILYRGGEVIRGDCSRQRRLSRVGRVTRSFFAEIDLSRVGHWSSYEVGGSIFHLGVSVFGWIFAVRSRSDPVWREPQLQ